MYPDLDLLGLDLDDDLLVSALGVSLMSIIVFVHR